MENKVGITVLCTALKFLDEQLMLCLWVDGIYGDFVKQTVPGLVLEAVWIICA